MILRKAEADDQPEIDFQAVEGRFIALNEARLQRTREALQPRQRDFLDLLPLLFHLNHALLPGYVSKNTPAGVVGYQPDSKTLESARRLAKGFEHKRQTLRRFPILGLYLMGSAGTIAYSEESDFDLWVCHDPELSAEEVDQLRQRADAIETWAEDFDLEVHCFLIDPERFRSGEIGGLSEESSGSAQHTLLLEEFYRTGLRLAGQYPLWWLVPPEKEAEYDTYVDDLKRKRFLHARDHIDLGGLAHVPAEEFFGAALWQLYKGIDSPYKSVLKLALMEAYANEYPHIELLSLRYKRAVYAGADDPDRLDPYLLMLEKAEEYLRGQDDQARLDLVRRCFYFKAGRQLSDDNAPGRDGWQHQRFQGLVAEWGWTRAELVVMDSRENWKVHRVSEERRILFEALSASYRALSSFARRYAGLALISQEDLTVLGRKLYAAFERKAGKVELVNRGITSDLTEPKLTIHQVADAEGRDAWLLFRGLVRPEDRKAENRGNGPLRRFRSAVELLSWCYFNGVLGTQTTLAFYGQKGNLTTKELYRLVEYLRGTFPYDDLGTRSMGDFARAARVVRAGFFINVGVDPFARLARAGDQITSSRSDPLRFGARAENLIAQVDLVLVTSWQEVLTYHYRGGKGLVACLCELLKWAPPSQGRRPAEVAVHAMSTLRGDSVTRRLSQLFE
ncbi:MAG TPA: class I adenylate cyclase, partial [Gammaproteobacteria bacterium]|nr:class I adenylate cyclase [Gammaproteobacteria bacterium]